MAIEQDSYDGSFYWSEKEVERRLRGMRRDFCDMIETKLRLLESENASYRDGYVDALGDVTDEVEFILQNRFNEITTRIQ